ncbi:protein transport protein Sec24 [Lentithecium fluviatile CBS 122367]|uniref:Protein transport protein SEC24 n=1 Tax=Lentithecium fluviatile CBS 122367 TaxID=1168545 RepID=A0A6G1JC96_9PLEO|nr:protein transport protein Sec24 [Lentithecium fluviatile CBS 122367]
MADRKKRDRYAGAAYEFGANAAGTVPSTGGAPPPAQYGIPAQGYPGPQAVPLSPQQDPNTLGQQFGQMNLGPQPVPVTPQTQQQAAPTQRNQLYPSDLVAQPVHASEIDQPPPPINLPPNLAATPSPHANCPPPYIRSTLACVPKTHSLLKKSKLPFALIVQPYTSLHDDEAPVPVIDDQVISRCRRCRAYINPFVIFLDHGHRWKCNMCNLTNDVPQAFDWDAAQQKSVDRWQRSELNYAVCEFVAPQEYMVRPPQPLVYLFLIEVGHPSLVNGLCATISRIIAEALPRIPNADGRTRVGFIGFDTSLYYFSIPRDGSENNEPSMLVVSDLDEPFLPTPDNLLVTLSECMANVQNFLEKLPAMFQDNPQSGSAMGSALRAGHRMTAAIGAKITVLSSSLPNAGFGKLENRERKDILGTSKEGSLLQTQNSFYKSFAVECSKNQVSIDMFLFSNAYQDVASLSNLPRYTGGQTWFYPGWNAARPEDAIKLAHEFTSYLSSEIGLEAVLRVRASTGLRMSAFYGNFFNRSSDLCAFPSFPRDQQYNVEVAIDETIARETVFLQAAVLHTSCNGSRRIRVMTLGLPTTENLADVYASADAQAITTYFSHKAVERALSSGLDAARDALQAKVIEILSTYRANLAGGSSGGLTLPANLRALPVLFLGLIKNVGLRKSAQIPSDLRAAALCLLSTLPTALLLRYIYPAFYSLHDMPDDAGVPDPQTGAIAMPPLLNLSSERIVPYGLYLLDDGVNQFLWVGRDAVPALLNDVFGVEDRTQVKGGKTTLPRLDNDFSERLSAVMEKSRDHKAKGVGSITVPHLYVVKEDGDPALKLWAQTLLVEDRADQGVSLQQWLGMLREKVVQ